MGWIPVLSVVLLKSLEKIPVCFPSLGLVRGLVTFRGSYNLNVTANGQGPMAASQSAR